MGNINSVKEHLFSALESSNKEKVAHILKEHPQLINSPITEDCKSTCLGKAVWRGDQQMIELLLGMGADINYAGPKGVTPLMWACKNNQPEVLCYLLQNGAKPDIEGPLEKSSTNSKDPYEFRFFAIEYAIIHGNYECALIILEQFPVQEKFIKQGEIYFQFAKSKQYRFVNYNMMIKHLIQRVDVKSIPNIFLRPEKPKLKDPVIDPREPWKDWFKRVLEFGTPPLVERQELPENLQPHKRVFGIYHSYLHGLNPYPQKQEDQKMDYFSEKNKSPSNKNNLQEFQMVNQQSNPEIQEKFIQNPSSERQNRYLDNENQIKAQHDQMQPL